MKKFKIALIGSALLFSINALALQSDYTKPIHVSSVSQHAKMKNNSVTFRDDVLLTQGSIIIRADKLIVTRTQEPNHEKMLAKR